jgi:hypothetical protein
MFSLFASWVILSSMQIDVIAPICLRFPVEESVYNRFEYSIDLFRVAIVLIDLPQLLPF